VFLKPPNLQVGVRMGVLTLFRTD